MGVVYLAEREEFQQRVALKLIRGSLDSGEIIRRFCIERDVLASFDHPNIARLLDGGTTDEGLPFLAMEHVDGEPIDRYCHAGELTIDETLRLFRKVCGAVSYAHQNLTVHRDIKPSNILVNEAGEPKLLDFGISKILSPDKFASPDTATADRLLTPEYASPEQLLGEKISTASDVYSLGVLLYELLTGRRPFELKDRSAFEIVEAVCRTEPRAPSSWRDLEFANDGTGQTKSTTGDARSRFTASQLRGDLDNIVLTALRKDPERRYMSVEQFSEDIRRYLDGLPVSARPATLKYRAMKFVRRNRVAVASTSIAAAALIAGFGIASWQAVVARNEKAIAEKRLNEVRGLANTFVNDWDKGLSEEDVSPEIRGRLADISSEYLTRLAADTDDPDVLLEAAQAHIKLGHTYAYFLIDLEKARQSLITAKRIARRLAENDAGDAAARSLLILSLLKYDEFFGQEDDVALIESKLEQIALREMNLASAPEDAAELRHLALAHEHVASVLGRLGRIDEARSHYSEADRLHERRIGILQKMPPTASDLARLSYSLTDRASNLSTHLSDVRSSIETMRRAVDVANQALASPGADRSARISVIDAYKQLGIVLKQSGDHSEAITVLRTGIGANRGFDENVKDGYFKRSEFDSLLQIAAIQLLLGEKRGTSETVREMFRIQRAWSSGEGSRNPARTFAMQAFLLELGGRLLAGAGEFSAAAAAFDEAEDYLKRVAAMSTYKPFTASLMVSRGDLYSGLNDCQEPMGALSRVDGACVSRSVTTDRQRLSRAAEYYRRSAKLIALSDGFRPTHADHQVAQIAAERLAFVE
jgi:tetratricopeptide (TPR) repeat protein